MTSKSGLDVGHGGCPSSSQTWSTCDITQLHDNPTQLALYLPRDNLTNWWARGGWKTKSRNDQTEKAMLKARESNASHGVEPLFCKLSVIGVHQNVYFSCLAASNRLADRRDENEPCLTVFYFRVVSILWNPFGSHSLLISQKPWLSWTQKYWLQYPEGEES